MISKNQIKFVRSLQLKKHRDVHNSFVVEGEKIVNEIIQSDFSVIQIFATNGWLSSNTNIIAEVICQISEKELKKISQLSTPNKVLAIVEKPKFTLNIDTITNGLTLVLDEIKDPGNLGTIIRMCDWFGVKQIICSENTVDIYNPKVVQSTMGSLFRTHVIYTDLIKYLAKVTTPVYGAYMDGENVKDIEINQKAHLVMGNEANGISEKIEKHISKRVAIKNMGGNIESLNVAVATSILLHEFCS